MNCGRRCSPFAPGIDGSAACLSAPRSDTTFGGRTHGRAFSRSPGADRRRAPPRLRAWRPRLRSRSRGRKARTPNAPWHRRARPSLPARAGALLGHCTSRGSSHRERTLVLRVRLPPAHLDHRGRHGGGSYRVGGAGQERCEGGTGVPGLPPVSPRGQERRVAGARPEGRTLPRSSGSRADRTRYPRLRGSPGRLPLHAARDLP